MATFEVFYTELATGTEKQATIGTDHGAGHAIELVTGVRPFEIHREGSVYVAGVKGFKEVSAYKVTR